MTERVAVETAKGGGEKSGGGRARQDGWLNGRMEG